MALINPDKEKKKKSSNPNENLGLGLGAISVSPPRIPSMVEGGALGSLVEQAMENRKNPMMDMSERQGLFKKKRNINGGLQQTNGGGGGF